MSRQTNQALLDSETTTGPSESVITRGHTNVTLAVVSTDLSDSQTLSVGLEHSPRGNEWESVGTVTQDDFDGSLGSVRLSEVALEHLRANVTENPDNVSVDGYILMNGNAGSGRSGRER